MADRVKYFVLGLLFLVVAGVIAYDRWNRKPIDDSTLMANEDDAVAPEGDRFEVIVGPDLDVTPEPQAKPEPKKTPPPGIKPFERDFKTLLEDTPPATDPATRPPAPKVEPEVEREPKVEPKPAPERYHVVRKGENLSKISQQYYKTVKGVNWIVQRNGLRDPNSIREGQKLIIPASKVAGRRGAVVPPKKTPRPSKVPTRYTVKAGDGDLYAICRRFYGTKGEGARVARIMKLNGLWSAKVKAGTTLELPPK